MDGSDIDPVLTFLGDCDAVIQVRLDEFAEGKAVERGVPIRRLQTIAGETVLVTTIYDLLMAHYGVPRGLEGEYPQSYDDETADG